MKKLLVRTLSGAVYVLLIVFAIYGDRWLHTDGYPDMNIGDCIFSFIFFIITMTGTYEVVHNLKLSGKSVNAAIAYTLAAITYLVASPIGLVSVHGLYIIIVFFPAIALMVQLWRKDEDPMACVGNSLLPLFWLVAPILMLCFMQIHKPGLVMMLFILVWVNDTFAYLTGMLIGKHKMWERHSPNKTWEGTVGGALFCIAAAVFIGPLFDYTAQFTTTTWAMIGLVTSVAGTLGDLVESMFKRSCGVKDSGNIMPGHGGILDRLDSILMTTPFVFFIFILENASLIY